jgi:hypothetical protein
MKLAPKLNLATAETADIQAADDVIIGDCPAILKYRGCPILAL